MCYIEWIWPETNEEFVYNFSLYFVFPYFWFCVAYKKNYFFRDPWLMYFKALEFRTSHYFIMFMCESFSIAIGHDRSDDSSSSKYMTKPSSIEFPRSLVEVVVFWNVPMHVWLKTCSYFSFKLIWNFTNPLFRLCHSLESYFTKKFLQYFQNSCKSTSLLLLKFKISISILL